jgi:acyl-CoA hydrolase
MFKIAAIFVVNYHTKNMEDRIQLSETRQFKAIFPCNLNANNTLFGGLALQWMDEVAFITATRFARRHMFTVNTENIKFMKLVGPDSIVEVVGRVEKAGAVKLRVKVEVYVEGMFDDVRELAIEGVFVFAALDEAMKPQRLSDPGK